MYTIWGGIGQFNCWLEMVILHLCTNSLLVVKQLQHMQKLIVGGEQDKYFIKF